MSAESIKQEIMASQEASSAEVLQTPIPASISTTIQTNFAQQNEGITTIATVSLPETMTAAEAIVATESISVGTQVVPDRTLGGQEMEESIPQVQPHESVDGVSGTEESIVISTESVGIAPTNSSEASIQLANLSTVSSNYPWATRLHDCELIGDSYRGYVTNEVELDLILTLHKQHTNSCWGTRQSPSSAKPSIRLMWKSQYVPYDGIPFLNTGRRATVMECQYGPRRKGSVNKKHLDYDDHGSPIKIHRPTCPARIYVKKVRKFPEFRIDPNLEGKNVRQAQERALTALRLAGVETGGEERYYVQLPLPIAHEYHDIDDIPMGPDDAESQGQRLNLDVTHKIRELVARGVTGIYTVKHCLKEYVEKELFVGLEPPPRHNKSFFPTIIDIQNHIHQAQMALATGSLLPLPPLTNLPISSTQIKEKTRKRKQAPEKLSQSCQTTSQTVASIQAHDESRVQALSDQEQRQLIQQSGGLVPAGTETHQMDILQSSEGHTAEVDISSQPQILITQGARSGREDGQVVIVVTSNNLFSGQSESETPTTLSLAIPASQVASLSPASIQSAAVGPTAVTFIPQQMTTTSDQATGSSANPQTLTFIPQALDNSRTTVAFLSSEQAQDSAAQAPVSTAYLAAQGQSGNLLTVLDSAVQASVGASAPVIRVGANLGAVQMADGSQLQNAAPGHLLSNQAAVEAVLNAATTRRGAHQTGTHMEGEPQAKRPALGVEFASLVKETVFDSQQVAEETCLGQEQTKSTTESEQSHVQMVSTTTTAAVVVEGTDSTPLKLSEANGGEHLMPMESQSVVMVTQPVLSPVQDGSGIVHMYQENNHSLLGNNSDRHSSVDTQLYNAAEHMVALSQESVTRQVTKATPNGNVQDVVMETVSSGTGEGSRNQQALLPDAEQTSQEYDMHSQETNTASGEQDGLHLMFENGDRISEEEASIASHSNNSQGHVSLCDNVQLMNAASTVFTQ